MICAGCKRRLSVNEQPWSNEWVCWASGKTQPWPPEPGVVCEGCIPPDDLELLEFFAQDVASMFLEARIEQ